jgi:hypothetical protein
MKLYYRSFLILLIAIVSASTSCSANSIDVIKTDEDVFTFIRQFYPHVKLKGTFGKYYNETIKFADSLKVKNWVKTDIDNNGETDLLMFNADGLPEVFAVISIHGKYRLVEARYFCKHQFIYPVVKNNILMLYSNNIKGYDQDAKTTIYSKLECDTLTLVGGFFANYNKSTRHSDIKKIEINVNGMCEGNCPRINILINPARLTSICLKQKDDRDAVITYTGQLTSTEIHNILQLLNQSNIDEFKNEYSLPCSDQTTTTLTITFADGRSKKISDYGSSGNFTLTSIYDIAYGIKWRLKK